ncbi:hypothetical protein D3C77_445480 [compost metagenome]
MAGIRIKITKIWEHGIPAIYIGHITYKQLNHPAPTSVASPILICSGNLRCSLDEIPIMEMMIIQLIGCSVAVRITDDGTPIIVVIKNIGCFQISRGITRL